MRDGGAMEDEGGIFATSVGPSPRPEFDLAVTHAPEETLRSSAGGARIAVTAEPLIQAGVVVSDDSSMGRRSR